MAKKTAPKKEKRAKTAVEAPRRDMFLVPPEKLTLVTDENHFLYDERVHLPLDESMVANIMALGIKQNITIAKEGDALLVVNGRQRVKSALEANKRLAKLGEAPVAVPCVLQGGEEDDKFAVMISTNEICRADGILVKARKAARYLDRGHTPAEAATIFGVVPRTILNWIKLLGLCETVKDAVEAGRIGPTAAAQLADLAPAEQKERLKALLESEGKITVETAARVAEGPGSGVRGSGSVKRPSRRALKVLVGSTAIPTDVRWLLKWIEGEIEFEEAKRRLAWLEPFRVVGTSLLFVEPPKAAEAEEDRTGDLLAEPPGTQEQIDECVRSSLYAFEGDKEKWAARAGTPLSNAELRALIVASMPEYQGSSEPVMWTARGGTNPSVEIGGLKLKGNGLLFAVRRSMTIPQEI